MNSRNEKRKKRNESEGVGAQNPAPAFPTARRRSFSADDAHHFLPEGNGITEADSVPEVRNRTHLQEREGSQRLVRTICHARHKLAVHATRGSFAVHAAATRSWTVHATNPVHATAAATSPSCSKYPTAACTASSAA